MRKKKSRRLLLAPLFLLSSLLASLAAAQTPPPVPVVIHPIPPRSRVLETVYQYEDGERRFAVRYALPIVPPYIPCGIEFLSAERRGIHLRAENLRQITEALRRLDAISSFLPGCSESSGSIRAYGRLGRRQAVVDLWSDSGMQTSDPVIVGEFS